MYDSTNNTVILSKSEFDELVEDSNFLSDLREAGVDNWEGYSEACALRRERHNKDD